MRNNKTGSLIKISAGIVLVVAAYCLGAGIIPVTFDFITDTRAVAGPAIQNTPTVEARLVSTHTVEYVEQTVVRTEFVDVVRQVNADLRNFASLDELEHWIFDIRSLTTISFRQEDSVTDCDDYALDLQRKALEAGFLVSFQIIGIREYNEKFAIPLPESGTLHAINLAVIGNSVFYIEPQTGEVVHAAYLD